MIPAKTAPDTSAGPVTYTDGGTDYEIIRPDGRSRKFVVWTLTGHRITEFRPAVLPVGEAGLIEQAKAAVREGRPQ